MMFVLQSDTVELQLHTAPVACARQQSYPMIPRRDLAEHGKKKRWLLLTLLGGGGGVGWLAIARL